MDDELELAWEAAGAKLLELAAAGVVPGRMPVVRYLATKLAPFYRIVLDVLVEEESQLGLQLPTATIAERTAEQVGRLAGGSASCPPVAGLLDQLYEWGNVDRIHNTHRKGSYQEYLKQDFLYQMTPAGTIVHRELSRIDQELGVTGALQASMLPEVLQALVALASALDEPEIETEEEAEDRSKNAYAAFSRVVNGFTQLSDNAKLFVQGLNRSLHVDSEEKAESFLAYKRVVVDYLQTFSVGLSKFASSIAEAIELAESRGVLIALQEIAGVDAAPALGVTGEAAAARDAEVMQAQWTGLRRWFFADGDQQPVVNTLTERSVDAISRIMTTVRQLNDERFRRVNRRADLVTMARWFSAEDADVVRLWRAGFGLYPARHLGAPHAAEAELDIRPGFGWWEGVAPPISPRLRTQGPRASSGVSGRLPDQSAAKRLLRERQRAQDAAVEAAARSLVGRTPCRLSSLTHLPAAEFDLLVRCFDVALASNPREGVRRAETSDGLIRVTLAPARPGEFATIATPRGTLSIADFHISLEDMETSS
ncbi:TIGR02677 family protein [Lentzea sp. NPDC054927]